MAKDPNSGKAKYLQNPVETLYSITVVVSSLNPSLHMQPVIEKALLKWIGDGKINPEHHLAGPRPGYPFYTFLREEGLYSVVVSASRIDPMPPKSLLRRALEWCLERMP